MKFLVDTNVFSELRKGERAQPGVAAWARRTPAEHLGTSVVVLAEIRRGVELKRLRDEPQALALERWFFDLRRTLADRVLPIDEPIADLWARLNAPSPLPFVDGLLAATALTHDLTLVTRNVADVRASGAKLFDPFTD